MCNHSLLTKLNKVLPLYNWKDVMQIYVEMTVKEIPDELIDIKISILQMIKEDFNKAFESFIKNLIKIK